VKVYFEGSKQSPAVTTLNGGHGRIETRSLRVCSDIQWLRDRHPKWSQLTSILAVTSQREMRDKTEQETRYFISSLDDSDPERLINAVRAHWSIENNLHWVYEDSNRAHTGYSAANLSVIRHISLNLIKAEKSSKVGVKTKRAKAGWDNKYPLKILNII